MGSFFYEICNGLLSLIVWVIIADAILSWLVAFDVVNLRNRFVGNIAHVLSAISRPVLAPFRRFIPPLGGVDITPVIALLVIQAAQHSLLPLIFRPLL
jgi:YggT family protein